MYSYYKPTTYCPIQIEINISWDIVDVDDGIDGAAFQVSMRTPEKDWLKLTHINESSEITELTIKPLISTIKIIGSMKNAAICLIHYIQIININSISKMAEEPNWLSMFIFNDDQSRILSCDMHLDELAMYYNNNYDVINLLK